ncbi:MAG TPA: hypothetical protein PKN33_10215 [Phycisphaerae bacterium]|nr:hypothetical protein [Phycisphaerae bacterium]
MSWYADLAPCDYFGHEHAGRLRAVGWLERGQPFRQDTIASEVFRRLQELLKDPWSQIVMRGMHACDLCCFVPEAHGCSNLFVPGNGFLYVCPELICHYINAHGYAPPAEFCQCVLTCPEMRTMEYRRAILANGGHDLITSVDS